MQHGHLVANPFLGLKLSKYGKKPVSWSPFSRQELAALFKLDMERHERVLLTILATTGMRLDEAALLKWEDVKKDDNGIRYFDLTERQDTLKNIGSARRVPIPDAAWPIVLNYRLILQASNKGKMPTGRMFPHYNLNADGKTTGMATYALLNLIRQVTDDPRKVVHSLRGSFKDMLRDAGVSKEINDFITGHGSGDVAGKYGSGPSLRVRSEALQRCNFGFLSQEKRS